MKTVTSKQMRDLDRLTIESGIPGFALMNTAGTAAGKEILQFISFLHPIQVKRFAILAGKGNNGGDAYVVARFLSEKTKIPLVVYSICRPGELSEDSRLEYDKLPNDIKVKVKKNISKKDFDAGDIIVDGLLGTGTNGPLRPPLEDWISTVNSLNLPVISLDIPSGLSGDDGSVPTSAIKADLTITIGLPKIGLLCGRGPELCGSIRCVEIGIPKNFISKIKSDIELVLEQDVRPFISRLPLDSHKNSKGRTLIIAGSFKYAGAPYLAAEAALRSGSGLVHLAIPEKIDSRNKIRALIVSKVPDNGKGVFSSNSIPELERLSEASDSIVIGPGISSESCAVEMLKFSTTISKPVVFDADALNIISICPEILLDRKAPSVLTPHPGEMKRLLTEFGLKRFIDADRITQALKLAEKSGAVVVLKGHRTIITSKDGRILVNGSGSPALATAGSGDVLAGMIGSFIAQGLEPCNAATVSVFIHGLAGEISPSGCRGTIADDLPRLIPQAMKMISPFA